jgi:hypothetical protein
MASPAVMRYPFCLHPSHVIDCAQNGAACQSVWTARRIGESGELAKMAARMTELEPRVIERLRAELAELIAASVAYPPFFDFRANRLITRPIDRARMDEIQRFLSSVNFAVLERADVTSAETRRFLERLIVRYLEVNDGMRSRYAVRLLPRMRALAPRVAAEAQRRATGYLNGVVPDFGARRQTVSWANSSHRAVPRSGEERERATRVLESALLQRPGAPADPAPIIGQARPPAASAPDPWRGQPDGLTIPVPATGFAPSSPGASPYSAFGDVGARSNGGAPAPGYPPARLADQPTGPLATPPASPAGQANRAGMRELPPDLYQLYGDYLNDMEPEAPVRPAPRPPAPPPAARQQPPTAPTDANARNDQLIFWQLRYQLEAYVRRAARSYGVPHQGSDPATVLDELRRSGFVDEADLRIAEGVFALTDRVTAQGHATEQEYRQALMLYLLYHRSHLNI